MKHYDIDDLTLDRLSHNTLIALHTVFIKTCSTSFDVIDRSIAIVCISCHPSSNYNSTFASTKCNTISVDFVKLDGVKW